VKFQFLIPGEGQAVLPVTFTNRSNNDKTLEYVTQGKNPGDIIKVVSKGGSLWEYPTESPPMVTVYINGVERLEGCWRRIGWDVVDVVVTSFKYNRPLAEQISVLLEGFLLYYSYGAYTRRNRFYGGGVYCVQQ